MIPDSVPAAVSLATSVYFAACVPLLLRVDDPVWPSRRELGDRLLVEIVRARGTAADARARAALSAAALLLILSARKGVVR